MIKSRTLQTVALAAMLAATSAFAETTPANSTTADAQNVAPKLLDKLKISYVGQFIGPAVAKLDMFQPNADGSAGSPIVLSSALNPMIKINDRLSAGITLPFDYTFVAGHTVTLYDPGLRFTDSKLISFQGFSLSNDIRAYLPTGIGSLAKNDVHTYFKLTQIANYEIPGTKWSAGALFIEKLRIYGQKAVSTHTPFEIYAIPMLNYQANSKVGVNFWHDVVSTAYKPDKGGLLADDLTAGMGVTWDVSSKVNLNPYIQFLPWSQGSMIDTTSLGMFISAKLL